MRGTLDEECAAAAARPFENARLDREWRTLVLMIQCYCRKQHGSADRLCPDCQDLHYYVNFGIEWCRF
jgi:hypothetical protein